MNNKQKYDRKYDKEHYDKVLLRLPKNYKDLIKDRATDLKKSVNQYIVDLIMQDLYKK